MSSLISLSEAEGISKQSEDTNAHERYREALKTIDDRRTSSLGRHLRASNDYDKGQRCSDSHPNFRNGLKTSWLLYGESYQHGQKRMGESKNGKHAAGSPERVKACRTHEGLRTSQTEACRWISREGQSLPCSWGTVYRPNGNMPLDLQKGSKFTVLIRDPYKQNTESMPLDLQRGSKFPVLAKDTIYTALLLSFFERKPWRIDPKPYVQKNSQANSQGRLNLEEAKRWARDGGKEKEEVDSAFFERKLLPGPWWMDSKTTCPRNSTLCTCT